MTQVPPTLCSSATATRAPCPEAMRAARTPPEPAPITNRSKSLIIPLSRSAPASTRRGSRAPPPSRRVEARAPRLVVELARHFLAQLDPELVERVDPDQHRIGESAMLVEG